VVVVVVVVVVLVLVVVEVLVVVVVVALVVEVLLVAVVVLLVDVPAGALLVGAEASGAEVTVACGARELDAATVLAVGSAATSSAISSDPVPHDAPTTQSNTSTRRMGPNGIGSVAL